jgi:hypothetical protein
MNEEQPAGDARAVPTLEAQDPAPHPHPGTPGHCGNCGNCGTPLAGAYCHACGQRGHLHRSLLHLAEEILHGVLHFDTKSWRTLPLLVARPGLLTRRYIDGQRARHVPPLALFLFTMFLSFLVVSMTSTGSGVPWSTSITQEADEKRAGLLEAVSEARRDVAELERNLVAAQREQSSVDKAGADLAQGRRKLLDAERALKAFDDAAPQRAALAALEQPAAQGASAPDGTAASGPAGLPSGKRIETGSIELNEAFERVLKNPELAFYKLKNTAYKFSFLLVPLLLPFMWLMFIRRRDIAVYDHAVFALYSLSFMALLVIATALLSLTPLNGHLGWLLWLVPLHVFLQLRKVPTDDPRRRDECFQRGLKWMLTFQCKDGGWAAFDKDCTKSILEKVPFADHNAMLDPECADITARILELLGYEGWDVNHPQIEKALDYIREQQEEDGSWYGRWGVNYIYGTWQVLRGLRALGIDMNQPWLLKARDWLESVQHSDGGWGERCNTYDDPVFKGRGPSTASQTAWAVMGLLAFEDPTRASVQRGIDYLARTQNADGSWTENEVTGTGFPKVFYLKYDMYRNAWPLLALATYRNLLNGVKPGFVEPVSENGSAESSEIVLAK